MTGTLAHIWRHPIKSHGSEALPHVTLAAGATMPWDRTWAVAHEASRADNSAWSSCVNFSRGAKAPALMAITAELDEATEVLTLRHPDLDDLVVKPEAETDRFLDWVRPLMPEGRAQSARIVRVPGRGMTDTDFPSISLLNLSSNRAVGQKLGQELDPRRWRGNLWFDGLGPWEEFEWVGKRLQLGGATLEVRERITRCMATTANPLTGKRDADTLGALEGGWGHQDFGVYAEVVEPGEIRLGDGLTLV